VGKTAGDHLPEKPRRNHWSLVGKPQSPKPNIPPEPEPNHRRLAAILRLSRGDFHPYDSDDAGRHADGFIFGTDDRPHWAHLASEDAESPVLIKVRLGRTPPLSGRDYEALMRVQRDLNYSKVDYDPEERLLALVAAPTCLDPANDGQAVRMAIKELQKAVTDDRLLSLVSKRVAPRGKEPNRTYRKEKKS
jgi:hypothetical protein